MLSSECLSCSQRLTVSLLQSTHPGVWLSARYLAPLPSRIIKSLKAGVVPHWVFAVSSLHRTGTGWIVFKLDRVKQKNTPLCPKASSSLCLSLASNEIKVHFSKLLVMGSLFYLSCCIRPKWPFKWSLKHPLLEQFQMLLNRLLILSNAHQSTCRRGPVLKLGPESTMINECWQVCGRCPGAEPCPWAKAKPHALSAPASSLPGQQGASPSAPWQLGPQCTPSLRCQGCSANHSTSDPSDGWLCWGYNYQRLASGPGLAGGPIRWSDGHLEPACLC